MRRYHSISSLCVHCIISYYYKNFYCIYVYIILCCNDYYVCMYTCHAIRHVCNHVHEFWRHATPKLVCGIEGTSKITARGQFHIDRTAASVLATPTTMEGFHLKRSSASAVVLILYYCDIFPNSISRNITTCNARPMAIPLQID